MKRRIVGAILKRALLDVNLDVKKAATNRRDLRLTNFIASIDVADDEKRVETLPNERMLMRRRVTAQHVLGVYIIAVRRSPAHMIGGGQQRVEILETRNDAPLRVADGETRRCRAAAPTIRAVEVRDDSPIEERERILRLVEKLALQAKKRVKRLTRNFLLLAYESKENVRQEANVFEASNYTKRPLRMFARQRKHPTVRRDRRLAMRP